MENVYSLCCSESIPSYKLSGGHQFGSMYQNGNYMSFDQLIPLTEIYLKDSVG